MFQESLLKSSLRLPILLRIKPKLLISAQALRGLTPMYISVLLSCWVPPHWQPLWLPFGHSYLPYPCHPRTLVFAWSTVLCSYQQPACPQLMVYIASQALPSQGGLRWAILLDHLPPDGLSKHCEPPCPSTSCSCTFAFLCVVMSIVTYLVHEQDDVCFPSPWYSQWLVPCLSQNSCSINIWWVRE